MGEKLSEGVDEIVDLVQIRGYITGYAGSISEALIKNASERGYSNTEIQPTVDYLKGKTDLFRKGLVLSDDYSLLKDNIEYWFGMARAVALSANELETSDRVIRQAVDGIQGNLLVNKMLTEEAKAELAEKWSVPKKSE